MSGALQVLGFILSLVRGSEVGTSQSGKWRGSTGWLGTWGPDPSARSPGAATGDRAARGWGADPGSAGTTWVGTIRLGFSTWALRERHSWTTRSTTSYPVSAWLSR